MFCFIFFSVVENLLCKTGCLTKLIIIHFFVILVNFDEGGAKLRKDSLTMSLKHFEAETTQRDLQPSQHPNEITVLGQMGDGTNSPSTINEIA